MELHFTKFFDVKSPIGVEEITEIKTPYHSIGVDLYMPLPTKEFIENLVNSNNGFTVEYGKNNSFNIRNKNNEIILDFFGNTYNIYDNIQIPTGIGILIPENYYIEVTSKSSNFKFGFSIVDGKIDEDYTYGMGIQLFKLNSDPLIIEPNQKIVQLILKKGYKIHKFNEISLNDWDKLEAVKLRRFSRNGGFGSTGKF